jgi:hypothetical protein
LKKLYEIIGLIAACLLFILSPSFAAPYFRESGLVDIPTGRVLEHGLFGVGTYFGFQNSNKFPRDEAAIRLDFGLFDRVEVGLTRVGYDGDSFLLGNLKVLLFREADSAPNVAVGVENIGDGDPIRDGLDDLTRYERKSAFLAVSKIFNLPRVHLISGHIGVGNNRFTEDIGMGKVLNGVFFGLSKDFSPAFARGDLTVSLEVDGRGVNAGMRHTANSGLQVYLGAEALNAPATDDKEIRYLVGVSWSNRALLKQLRDAKNLAKQAALSAQRAEQSAKESK